MFRELAYASHPSLWLDEAMLALNVAERSFGALTQPLAMNQVAPFPFLWLVKAATLLGGVNELSLRLVPLMAGVALLGVLWWAVRPLLGARAGVVAVALAAVCPLLLQYSNEVKQYELDALVTVTLVGLVAAVLTAPERGGRWWGLAVGGVAGLFFSQPAIFVLVGGGAALLLDRGVRQSPAWRRRTLGVACAWLVSFGVLYALIYRQAARPSMALAWEETFLLPGSPDFLGRMARMARMAVGLALPDALTSLTAVVPLALLLLGLWLLWRRRGPALLAMVLGPFGAVLVAAALGKYPISARVLVFTVPLWILAYAAALEWLSRRVVPRRILPYAWSGAVLGFGILALSGDRQQPWGIPVREDARGLIRWVEQQRGSVPVYVFNDGLPLWAFYTTNWNAADTLRSLRIRRAAFRTREELGDVASYRPDNLVVWGRAIEDATILGLASPARWREARGWIGTQSDSLWAIEEAVRIRAATPGQHLWIVGCHYRPELVRRLLDQLGQMGGVVVQSDARPGAVAYRLRFADAHLAVASEGLRPSSPLPLHGSQPGD
jgi:hypothetical protein